MNQTFYPISRRALVLDVVLAVALASLVNLLIFKLGWNASSQDLTKPVGFTWVDRVVPWVWIILFGLMAFARWIILRANRSSATRDASLVLGLIVFCALYPVYTFGFRLLPGLVGNFATVLLAGFVAFRVRNSSSWAATIVGLVIGWVLLASIYLLLLLQNNPLVSRFTS